tara:strand:+ start:84 stop:773 length:690 start_codon:yes stop_codon:yes gene_type:complete
MTIGYIRNSRLSQENSVETQKNIIEEYCDRYGLELNEIIIDEGISGSGEKVNDRVGYKKILKMIEDGKVDNLIVLSISRWGRNLGEIYRTVEMMEKNNTKFYSIKENIDTSSIYGRFVLNLLGSLYEMELSICKERTRDTLRVRKENNKVYSKIPYGFDRVGDDLVENSKEEKMIRKMMRLRNSGKSYGEIVDYLNRNRYKNKSGNKFSRGNVSWLINSRLKENYSYIG